MSKLKYSIYEDYVNCNECIHKHPMSKGCVVGACAIIYKKQIRTDKIVLVNENIPDFQRDVV